MGGTGRFGSCKEDFYNSNKIVSGYNYRPTDADKKILRQTEAEEKPRQLFAATPCPERIEKIINAETIVSYGGHGTAVAGIAAGNSQGVASNYIGGVSPQSKLYLMKTARVVKHTETGPGLAATAFALIDIIRKHPQGIPAYQSHIGNHYSPTPFRIPVDAPAIKVVSMSMSFTTPEYDVENCDEDVEAMFGRSEPYYSRLKEIKQAIDTLTNTFGISVVVSGGNTRNGDAAKLVFPACLENTIAVGSVLDDGTNRIDPSTRYSVLTDILAPSDITTTINAYAYNRKTSQRYDGNPADELPAGYVNFVNTSASAPYAAGAIAILQSAAKTVLDQYLTPAEVLDALVENGKSVSNGRIEKPLIDLRATLAAVLPIKLNNHVTEIGE